MPPPLSDATLLSRACRRPSFPARPASRHGRASPASPASPIRCLSPPISISFASLLGQQLQRLLPGRMKSIPVAAATLPVAERWWDQSTVAVVTGGNKGIGKEIARGLASNGVLTVLTARNESLGEAAAKEIAGSTGGTVVFHQLDITDADSRERFATWLEGSYGGLTVLVNNAGIAYKGSIFGPSELKATLDTNFRGTMAISERLKGLLTRPGGRVVNVGSRSGQLRAIGDANLRGRFESASTRRDLEILADEFQAAVEQGVHDKLGWPSSMYGVSKLCEGMYTRILGRELSAQGLAANVCCPGWCATDMSSWSGPKTALEGADTPVWLALAPPGGPSGCMYAERQQISF